MKQRQELLNNGEGEILGDAVMLSLTVAPGSVHPGKARFEITRVKGTSISDPFETTRIPESAIASVTSAFMEGFLPLMQSKGYRLNPFAADTTEPIYSEECDTGGRTVDQITRDFQESIRTVKNAIAAARFGKAGGQRSV